MGCLANDCFDIATLVVEMKAYASAARDFGTNVLLGLRSHEEIAGYVVGKLQRFEAAK